MSEEFDAIPMDDYIVVEKEQPIPEGEYSFKVLQIKREQNAAKNAMPQHINMKFQLELSNDTGSYKTWDNIRMYRKWAWKYAELARAIDHTLIGEDRVKIDWGSIVGKEGKLTLKHGEWKKDNGTTEIVNNLKYLEAEIPF